MEIEANTYKWNVKSQQGSQHCLLSLIFCHADLYSKMANLGNAFRMQYRQDSSLFVFHYRFLGRDEWNTEVKCVQSPFRPFYSNLLPGVEN